MRCISTIFITCILFSVHGQSFWNKGIYYFEKRADGADGLNIQSTNIDSAIYYFQAAIHAKQREQESIRFLLRSYYYKGAFTPIPESQKALIYGKGKDIGEQMIQEHPNSAPILFWYIACLAKWGESSGKVTAVREGVVDKMKVFSEKLMVLDDRYCFGGAYRILGALHYEVPYIPFFLTWPSLDESIVMFQKAKMISTEDPNTQVYLAKALIKKGREKEAKQELLAVIDRIPRRSHFIEDQYSIIEAKKILNDLDN